MQSAGLLENEIDLHPTRLPIVLQVRLTPSMDQTFENLTGHPAFEQRTAEGVTAQLIGVPDAEETARDAGVDEVELRRLDDLLADVSMPRGEEGGDEARLKKAEPRPRCVVRNTGVTAEGR